MIELLKDSILKRFHHCIVITASFKNTLFYFVGLLESILSMLNFLSISLERLLILRLFYIFKTKCVIEFFVFVYKMCHKSLKFMSLYLLLHSKLAVHLLGYLKQKETTSFLLHCYKYLVEVLNTQKWKKMKKKEKTFNGKTLAEQTVEISTEKISNNNSHVDLINLCLLKIVFDYCNCLQRGVLASYKITPTHFLNQLGF